MVLLRPAEKPWGIIAISVVLSTCVTAFFVLYPAQNAEGHAMGAARCACIIGHVGFASRCPVKNVHRERSVSRRIFRMNASGSSGPRSPSGKRSAVFICKGVLTEQRRGLFGPSGCETGLGRDESNTAVGDGPLHRTLERAVGAIAVPATGQAMGRATWRATREAALAAIWRATVGATGRATRTAIQTATVRATGRATGRATERVTGTATRPVTGVATGTAMERAIQTTTG